MVVLSRHSTIDIVLGEARHHHGDLEGLYGQLVMIHIVMIHTVISILRRKVKEVFLALISLKYNI